MASLERRRGDKRSIGWGHWLYRRFMTLSGGALLSAAAIIFSLVLWRLSRMEIQLLAGNSSSRIYDAELRSRAATTTASSEDTAETQQQQEAPTDEKATIKCSLTVVLLEPRLPYFPANDTVYINTLESMADYIPASACIVLQTSVCLLQECMAGSVNPEQLLYYANEAETQTSRLNRRHDERDREIEERRRNQNVSVEGGLEVARVIEKALKITPAWALEQNNIEKRKKDKKRRGVGEGEANRFDVDKVIASNSDTLSNTEDTGRGQRHRRLSTLSGSRTGNGEYPPKKTRIRPLPGFDATILESCSATPTVSEEEAFAVAKSLIRKRSGPLLTKFWNRGRVRVSIIDPNKYNLNSCHAFNLNNILLSANYWIDEFIPNQDADQVLMIQRDAFLCKPLNLKTWDHFTYVGSPWFKTWPWMKVGYNNTLQMNRQSTDEYSVKAWRKYWTEFDRAHKGHYTAASSASSKDTNCDSYHEQVNNHHCPLPPHNDLVFPETLEPRQWVGNGGLSLRSRKWMIHMIRLCPKHSVSGLPDNVMKQATCVSQGLQEDMFFSVFLTLVGAKIANPIIANFFSMDQNFGWPTIEGDEHAASIEQWLGRDAWRQFQRERRELGYGIPVGQHKCFLAFREKIPGGYGCAPQKWCKYSFNTDDRPTQIMA